jgi:hypothetical protein
MRSPRPRPRRDSLSSRARRDEHLSKAAVHAGALADGATRSIRSSSRSQPTPSVIVGIADRATWQRDGRRDAAQVPCSCRVTCAQRCSVGPPEQTCARERPAPGRRPGRSDHADPPRSRFVVIQRAHVTMPMWKPRRPHGGPCVDRKRPWKATVRTLLGLSPEPATARRRPPKRPSGVRSVAASLPVAPQDPPQSPSPRRLRSPKQSRRRRPELGRCRCGRVARTPTAWARAPASADLSARIWHKGEAAGVLTALVRQASVTAWPRTSAQSRPV